MKCLECSEDTRKYKCPRCEFYCCSFDCYKKHKAVECVSTKNIQENDSVDQFYDDRKPILQFTTDDTVDPDKLAQLGNSETVKELLRNHHLRDFIQAIDTMGNARKAMKLAMLEPLFIEFADKCMKIVEPETKTD